MNGNGCESKNPFDDLENIADEFDWSQFDPLARLIFCATLPGTEGLVAYTCSSCGGQGLTAALKSISGTQKSHTARQGDTRTHELGHNLPY